MAFTSNSEGVEKFSSAGNSACAWPLRLCGELLAVGVLISRHVSSARCSCASSSASYQARDVLISKFKDE